MKKISFILIILISLTSTTFATNLQTEIDSYINNRYATIDAGVIDFEHVVGVDAVMIDGDSIKTIFIYFKNGAIQKTKCVNLAEYSAVQGKLFNGFTAFKSARSTLLKAASQDLSSLVKLQIVFQ